MNHLVRAALCCIFLTVCSSVAFADAVKLPMKPNPSRNSLVFRSESLNEGRGMTFLQASGTAFTNLSNLGPEFASSTLDGSLSSDSTQSTDTMLNGVRRTPAPELGSCLLLGTGFLAMAGLLRNHSRRKIQS